MANSAALDPTVQPTIESLKKEIDQIKQEQDKESHGFWGRIKRWGLVIALVGALIAISRGIYDLSVELWGEPKTVVYAGNDLGMILDSTAESIALIVDALITNEGKKDEVISQMTGKFWNESVSSNIYLPLARTDFN